MTPRPWDRKLWGVVGIGSDGWTGFLFDSDTQTPALFATRSEARKFARRKTERACHVFRYQAIRVRKRVEVV